jgi:hypothetical protein
MAWRYPDDPLSNASRLYLHRFTGFIRFSTNPHSWTRSVQIISDMIYQGHFELVIWWQNERW